MLAQPHLLVERLASTPKLLLATVLGVRFPLISRITPGLAKPIIALEVWIEMTFLLLPAGLFL